MTQPDLPQTVPNDEPPSPAVAEKTADELRSDTVVGEEAEPAPEPWTAERVSEWNAYYDVYVMLAALLLAFVASAVRVDSKNPVIWTHLKTGQLIAQQGAPVLADSFSYTETGARWINIPWLFQWSHAAIYKLVTDNVPGNNPSSAEQIGIGSLIALAALARLLTAWMLVNIRHPGPGLWWSAICVSLALGAIIIPIGGPFGVLTGGIALPGMVSPGNIGLLFLAGELLLLFRAYDRGSGRALYGLIPLFLLWVNVDQSFFVGLLLLAVATIGRALDGQLAVVPGEAAQDVQPADSLAGATSGAPGRPQAPAATGFIVLAICSAACLANPSTYRVFAAAISPIVQLFGPETELIRPGEFSFFGKQIQKLYRVDWYWLTVFYLLMVGLGLTSFLFNSRRFTWSRFLPFALFAAIWGMFMGYREEYAVVFAAVMTLNGQEWYHDRFGTAGRLGKGWTSWSVGGRLVTLAAIFFFVANIITGWRVVPGQPRFGFGFERGDFAFEAADYLARAVDIKGNVLNTSASQGDALIWRAFPARRTFYDGRDHLFSRDLLEEHRKIRTALRDDDEPVWKELLDRWDITSVMIDLDSSPETYKRLSQSPNWIPFYDDGRAVLFGRADAAEPDLTTFKNYRLDPELRAYKVSQPVPAADRPPTPTNWIDSIYQNRYLGRSQPHNGAALRWLQGTTFDENQPANPDPARCLLAIREARTALAANPDDPDAYRLLNLAYRILMTHEAGLLAGIPPTPENQPRVNTLTPNIDLLGTRFKQRVTALNYAIQTTPPPRTIEGRRELASLNLEMFQLFMQAGYIDLGRDRLAAALDQSEEGDFTPEVREQYTKQLDDLNERVKQIEDKLLDLQTERQAGPIERAAYARSQGAIGIAIVDLEEADRGNMAPIVVKPQLVELYCNTGWPDRAIEQLSGSLNEDPNTTADPGSTWIRQGQVYMLLGNYDSAATLWKDRAVRSLRSDRSVRALTDCRALLLGDAVTATNRDLTIPGLVNRQAALEYELGLCLLESGVPEQAAEHFTHALKLMPELPYRPIIVYYLEKIGKPVPGLPKKPVPAPFKPPSALDQPRKPTLPAAPTAQPASPTPAKSAAPKELAKPAKPKEKPKDAKPQEKPKGPSAAAAPKADPAKKKP
ncbi:MAG: tetratricopeptide repeat protein [Isosphaeraceae bacterium]